MISVLINSRKTAGDSVDMNASSVCLSRLKSHLCRCEAKLINATASVALGIAGWLRAELNVVVQPCLVDSFSRDLKILFNSGVETCFAEARQ